MECGVELTMECGKLTVECGALILKEKTREQKEADLIPKIQEAVNYGLQVLDSAFEQLDIKAGNSDSEEETNERIELILEPKVMHFVLQRRFYPLNTH